MPRGCNYQKALEVIVKAIEEATAIPEDYFCNHCPAHDNCKGNDCWEEGNCPKVIMKWVRENF